LKRRRAKQPLPYRVQYCRYFKIIVINRILHKNRALFIFKNKTGTILELNPKQPGLNLDEAFGGIVQNLYPSKAFKNKGHTDQASEKPELSNGFW